MIKFVIKVLIWFVVICAGYYAVTSKNAVTEFRKWLKSDKVEKVIESGVDVVEHGADKVMNISDGLVNGATKD